MKIENRFMFNSAVCLGFLVVVLGAFGAHALKATLSPYELSIWQTAIQYQMFHTPVILGLSFIPSNKYLDKALTCFVSGIIIFSGSLYILAISGIKILGMVTPIGGVILIIAWVLLFVAAKLNKTT